MLFTHDVKKIRKRAFLDPSAVVWLAFLSCDYATLWSSEPILLEQLSQYSDVSGSTTGDLIAYPSNHCPVENEYQTCLCSAAFSRPCQTWIVFELHCDRLFLLVEGDSWNEVVTGPGCFSSDVEPDSH